MSQDWDKLGEEINRTVQDALDSQNYSGLNQTIVDALNGAMDGLGRGLRGMGDAVDKTARNLRHQSEQKRTSPPPDYTYRATDSKNAEYSETGNQKGYSYHYGESEYRSAGNSTAGNYPAPRPELFLKTSNAKAGGIALTVTGGALGGTMLLLLIFFLLGIVLVGEAEKVIIVLCVVFGALSAVGGVLMGAGGSKLGMVKRFRAYIQELEGKDYCDIKELAERVKKSPEFIVKDIEKMILRGWFRQGHLDSQKTCLIVSDAAYEQYTALMQRMENQKREETLAKARQEEKEKKLDPQIKEILRTGDEYIRKIRKCNDAIPGEEISAKISHMEMLVDRIFDRVEQNPESVSDIRRLMEYYLPMTVKLLEAYEELDTQPVQGANIAASKEEIEKTLDTLNVAFEKLLDDMFQDTAWDVSADISVLKTMLAQEGLTKDAF